MNRVGVLKNYIMETQTTLMSFLISLIEPADDMTVRALLLLAFVVSEDEILQTICIQMNAVPLLLKMLARIKEMDSSLCTRYLEGGLLLVSALSAINEDCRKSIVDSKLLMVIVDALSHPEMEIRLASSQCARNLSRSVKNLRTSLFDAGIVTPLMKLLNDPVLCVQSTACATLCNMVLEFTPLKKVEPSNHVIMLMICS